MKQCIFISAILLLFSSYVFSAEKPAPQASSSTDTTIAPQSPDPSKDNKKINLLVRIHKAHRKNPVLPTIAANTLAKSGEYNGF